MVACKNENNHHHMLANAKHTWTLDTTPSATQPLQKLGMSEMSPLKHCHGPVVVARYGMSAGLRSS